MDDESGESMEPMEEWIMSRFAEKLGICTEFGHKWNICFNAKKSQILTLGGNSHVNFRLCLDSRRIEWRSKMKYLGIHILAGDVQKLTLPMLKESLKDALTVFCLYVEKVETSLLHYTLLNHTVYHACFMAVKACC